MFRFMFRESVVETAALVNRDTNIESACIYTVFTEPFCLLRKEDWSSLMADKLLTQRYFLVVAMTSKSRQSQTRHDVCLLMSCVSPTRLSYRQQDTSEVSLIHCPQLLSLPPGKLTNKPTS